MHLDGQPDDEIYADLTALRGGAVAGLQLTTTLYVFLLDPVNSPFFDPSLGLPFLLSTFGTSVLWLLFVLFVLVVSTMTRNSKLVSLVFDAVADNPAPARAVAVVVSVPILVVGLVLIAVL